MRLQFHWVLVPLLVTTLFCLGTAAYLAREAFATASRGTLDRANELQSGVLLALAAQAFGQVVTVAGTTEPVMVAGMYLTLLGSIWAALTWFLFAALYTGHEHWLGRRTVALLTAGALLGTVLTLTDPVHGRALVDTGVERAGGQRVLTYGFGVVAWYAGVYTWAVATVAIWLLFRKFLTSRNVYRKIAFFHVVGGTTLNVTTFVASLGLGPFRYLTLAPATFALVIVVVAPTVVSYRFLRLVPVDRLFALLGKRFRNLSPMARDTIIETMQNGIVVVDHENRIVDLNPMGRRMLGATGRRVVGKSLRAVTPPSTFLTDDTGFLDPETTEGEFRGVWVETEDGERRCFDITITALGPRDDPAGRVALIYDVTDRERRKEMLRRRTEELERQNEQLDQFAGVVSHDLRNPLTVAKGYLGTIEGNDEAVAEVEHSLDRMESIIDDVLTLAREGRTLGETDTVTLDDLARDAWANAATDGASLVVADSLSFQADRARLLNLFENLFRNAVEHGSTSPRSQARDDAVEHGDDVTVTVGALEDGFFVADDGPGIPESERDAVLEFGYTTADAGTGFGLAIVSQIADAHGWDVAVTESATGGARFEFRNVERSSVETFEVSSMGE